VEVPLCLEQVVYSTLVVIEVYREAAICMISILVSILEVGHWCIKNTKYIQIFQQKGENISIDCNANQIGHHPDHKYQGLQNTSTSTSTNTNTK